MDKNYIMEDLNLLWVTIKPVVMYDAETWVLTKRDENILNTWERKVLRRIFGAVCINNEWRIRSNAELEELYKAPKNSG